ncbi:peptidylprolyl isomerase [Acidiferrimicrobium sp. IK]|uniref:peptidylprolyl isomerase n=1 Tax=Acidiferrimicrobium sp. IK TaxID=2871700 RepID=UPI0021CB1BE4|nr:peptidyl-prolyl cis-trans isomerase [Acidiferrimicrobium sp. IK]MCU4184410.1 peptidylprolyl isomerase [Acidiferrimicrobium sp. IK]
MTNGAARGAWDQLARALGTATAEEAAPATVPAGWDRLRDALSGTGSGPAPHQADVDEVRAATPGGWAQLRSALGGSAANGGTATTVLERPGSEKEAEVAGADAVVTAPVTAEATVEGDDAGTGHGGAGENRRGPRARAWGGRRAKAAAAVVAAAAVAGGVVLATAGTGSGLPAGDAFSVNGKAVSVADFNKELSVRQTLYGITPPAASDQAKYHTYLTSAAQAEAVSMLLDQVAPKQGVTVSAQTAQDSLSKAISTQYGGDQTKFATALSSAGLNQDQVLAEISHNLVYQKLFAKIIGSPTVTAAQIQAYFNQHRAQLAEPETRQISHIVVASQAAAQSIVDQLKAGKPFAALAASQSLDTATKANGGQLGLYAKDDLQAAFADAAFAAPPNVPFGPVHDSSGAWDVGIVTAVHPAAAATLNATTTTAIKTVLTDQAQAQAWDSWLGKQIASAHIVYAAKYKPLNPDAPPPIPVPNLTGETLAGVGPAAGTATSSGTTPTGSASGTGTSAGTAPAGG